MLLAHHPDIRIARRAIGKEGAPLLVIDNLVSDPDRLVRKASASLFVKQSSMFPGIRAPAPLSYRDFLQATLNPLLEEHFDLAPGRFVFPMCHFSLVTQPPGKLAFLQRVPHIDSVRGDGLASVHYLFRGDWGGTAFYRHRQSGFEYIDEERHGAYFDCLAQESRHADAASPGYIDEDTALFQRIADVEGVFNRMIVYRRNSLHSGRIDNARVPPADPGPWPTVHQLLHRLGPLSRTARIGWRGRPHNPLFIELFCAAARFFVGAGYSASCRRRAKLPRGKSGLTSGWLFLEIKMVALTLF